MGTDKEWIDPGSSVQFVVKSPQEILSFPSGVYCFTEKLLISKTGVSGNSP
jgi:hypothetical protein